MAWNKEYIYKIKLVCNGVRGGGGGGGKGKPVHYSTSTRYSRDIFLHVLYCNTKQGSLHHGIKNFQLQFRSAARISWAYILEEKLLHRKTNTNL